MNNISKQDIEKSVRDVLHQKHIPGEDKIRQIVKEEIEKYYEKEELEQKKTLSEKINTYIHDKKFVNIFLYIGMFVLLFLFVIGFTTLIEFGQQIKNNFKMINFKVVLWAIITLLITACIGGVSIKVYDKMIKNDCKYARIICLLELIYWCNISIPEFSLWVEKIL